MTPPVVAVSVYLSCLTFLNRAWALGSELEVSCHSFSAFQKKQQPPSAQRSDFVCVYVCMCMCVTQMCQYVLSASPGEWGRQDIIHSCTSSSESLKVHHNHIDKTPNELCGCLQDVCVCVFVYGGSTVMWFRAGQGCAVLCSGFPDWRYEHLFKHLS